MGYYKAEGVKVYQAELAVGSVDFAPAPGLGAAIRIRYMSLSLAGGTLTDTIAILDGTPTQYFQGDGAQAPFIEERGAKGQELYRFPENLKGSITVVGAGTWTVYIEYEVT